MSRCWSGPDPDPGGGRALSPQPWAHTGSVSTSNFIFSCAIWIDCSWCFGSGLESMWWKEERIRKVRNKTRRFWSKSGMWVVHVWPEFGLFLLPALYPGEKFFSFCHRMWYKHMAPPSRAESLLRTQPRISSLIQVKFPLSFRFNLWSCGNVVNYFPCFKAVLKSTDLARAWASGMFEKLVFRNSGSGSSILLQCGSRSVFRHCYDTKIWFYSFLSICFRYVSFLLNKRSKICFK